MARKRVAATKNGAKEIAARLVALRKARGITQVELATSLGSSQPLVSKMESGDLLIHAELVAKLAELYRVSADFILGLDDVELAPAIKDRRFLRRLQALDQLSKRDKDTVLRTIDAFVRNHSAA